MIAGIIGAISALAGLKAAYIFDTPAGPSIVCVASVFFVTLSVIAAFKKKLV